jgi:hypothetical protein
MTFPDMPQLLEDFKWSGKRASPKQVETMQSLIGLNLPADLADLMMKRGAGEGFVSEGRFLYVSPLHEWPRIHETLEAAINWPSLLIFGGDGGGKLYGWDHERGEYVSVEGIGDDVRQPLGKSLLEFLTSLAQPLRRV